MKDIINYYKQFEREFIQEENATKFTFLYFFFFHFFNEYVNVTYWFFLLATLMWEHTSNEIIHVQIKNTYYIHHISLL